MRLRDIPPADQAARIRAAIAYSGKEAKEIAATLGVSDATLRRRYTPINPTGVSSMEELHQIAQICGVPSSFMEEGFERFNGVRGALDGRIRALEQTQQRQVEQLREEIRDAVSEAVQAAQDGREALRSELDHLRDEMRSRDQVVVDAAGEQTPQSSPSRGAPARRPGRGA